MLVSQPALLGSTAHLRAVGVRAGCIEKEEIVLKFSCAKTVRVVLSHGQLSDGFLFLAEDKMWHN